MVLGKVLIFGCNSLCAGVVNQLQDRGINLSLVSMEEGCADRFQTPGVTVINADYTDDEVLRTLGIGQDVDVIFSFFEDDAKNVFLTLSSRAIDPELRIIALTQSEESSEKMIAAGATKVIDPYQISGRKIYDLIRHSMVAETMEKIVFGQQHLNLAEITIPEGSFLDGRHLDQLNISQGYNLVTVGVVDRELGNEFIFCSSGVDHKLDKNDVLVVIGPTAEINRLKRDAVQPGNPSRDA